MITVDLQNLADLMQEASDLAKAKSYSTLFIIPGMPGNGSTATAKTLARVLKDAGLINKTAPPDGLGLSMHLDAYGQAKREPTPLSEKVPSKAKWFVSLPAMSIGIGQRAMLPMILEGSSDNMYDVFLWILKHYAIPVGTGDSLTVQMIFPYMSPTHFRAVMKKREESEPLFGSWWSTAMHMSDADYSRALSQHMTRTTELFAQAVIDSKLTGLSDALSLKKSLVTCPYEQNLYLNPGGSAIVFRRPWKVQKTILSLRDVEAFSEMETKLHCRRSNALDLPKSVNVSL